MHIPLVRLLVRRVIAVVVILSLRGGISPSRLKVRTSLVRSHRRRRDCTSRITNTLHLHRGGITVVVKESAEEKWPAREPCNENEIVKEKENTTANPVLASAIADPSRDIIRSH